MSSGGHGAIKPPTMERRAGRATTHARPIKPPCTFHRHNHERNAAMKETQAGRQACGTSRTAWTVILSLGAVDQSPPEFCEVAWEDRPHLHACPEPGTAPTHPCGRNSTGSVAALFVLVAAPLEAWAPTAPSGSATGVLFILPDAPAGGSCCAGQPCRKRGRARPLTMKAPVATKSQPGQKAYRQAH
jgi:hypothetical protein